MMEKFRAILTLISGAAVLGASGVCVSADYETEILPILEKHCFSCHGPEKQKNDIRFDTLSTDMINDRPAAETWHDTLDVLNFNEMPPEDEPLA